MRNRVMTLLTCLFLLLGITSTTLPVFAFGDDLGTTITDNGGNNGNGSNTNTGSEGDDFVIPKEPLDEGTQGMADFLSGYQPVTPEQMEEGKKIATPIARFIGKIITVGIAFLTVWLFLQTVIDMIYILVPATQASLSGQVQVQGKVARCWVTTEALQAGGSAMPQQRGGMGMRSPGMGMGMGMRGPGMGMGMGASPMGMGGMGSPMGGAQQRQMTSSNMLLSYFKSRVVTLVVFGICVILLFSNLFLDFGTILGGWIYSIFTYIGNMMR